jgi:hypothetical protein
VLCPKCEFQAACNPSQNHDRMVRVAIQTTKEARLKKTNSDAG